MYAYMKFSPTFEKAAVMKVAKQYMKATWSQNKETLGANFKADGRLPESGLREVSSWRGDFFFSVYYNAK